MEKVGLPFEQVGRPQTLKGYSCHDVESGFYSVGSGRPLKCFKLVMTWDPSRLITLEVGVFSNYKCSGHGTGLEAIVLSMS